MASESTAKAIASFLADQGYGVLGGTGNQWGIYYSEEPPGPKKSITIYDTGGTTGNPDANMQDPTIQVRVRSPGTDEGQEKAENIRDLLILATDRIIGNWYYSGFWLISDVQKIGKDDNQRNLFTVNFRLMREPYTTE